MCIAHDVAFLFSANDFRGRNQPRLSIIESPVTGEEIRVIGYPGSHNTMQVMDSDAPELSFDLALVNSVGKINEAFPTGRDRHLAPYPCFSTSASMRSGQSGGPVIDMDKMGVVGINSRSFDGVEDYCIVSWLGKALDVPFGFDDIEFRNDDGKVIPVKNTSLRLLAQQGVVSIV
jgi:S1-C subfamily serine protease